MKKNNAITVHIYYTGENGSAKAFVKEMLTSGLVDEIRKEKGNRRYEYFFSVEDEETILLVDSWDNQEAIDLHHASSIIGQILHCPSISSDNFGLFSSFLFSVYF